MPAYKRLQNAWRLSAQADARVASRARATLPASAQIQQKLRFGILAVATHQERHRLLVVNLIFLVYWLLICEGVLRKWMFPQWGRALFFIRDPFVILIYVLVLAKRVKLRRCIFFEIGCMFGVAGLGLVFLQFALGNLKFSPALLLYGWRNYFLYIPLAFVVANYFDMADLQKLARRTLIFAVPMACVVVIQVHSSPLSPWNRGSGDTPETIYFVPNTIGDYIRPAGTFTSSLGFTAFVVSAVSLALGVWLSSSSRIMKRHWLVVGTIAIAACLTLSGSRGAMVWSGVVVIAAGAILSLANPQMGFKAIVITCMLAGAGVTLATVFFPDATAAFVQRWTSANEAEAQIYGSGGVFSRAVDEIVRFHILLPGRPSLGYGLGSAGNAAWTLGTRNQSIPFYNDREVGAAEVDWGRNVLELGPIVGVAFIVFRVAFVIWLAKEAFVATQRSGNPLPWMLWTFVSVLLSYGQITAHGTLNGYGWLFTGFCLAAVYQTRGTRSFRPA